MRWSRTKLPGSKPGIQPAWAGALVVLLLSTAAFGCASAQRRANRLFVVPAGFIEKEASRITLFYPPDRTFIRYLKYGRFSGSEVVVGITADKDKRVVGFDDGSFEIVKANLVEIDEPASHEIEVAGKVSSYKALTIAGTSTIDLQIVSPLERTPLASFCSNIPSIVSLSSNDHKISFAVLIRSNDNESCGPELAYNSHFESLGLSYAGSIALSPNRVFFRLGHSIVSVPSKLDAKALVSCRLVIPGDDYQRIVDKAASREENYDIVGVEAQIEQMLIKYTNRGKRDGC